MILTLFQNALVALVVLLFSALISGVLVKQGNVMDIPNARSSHGSSTPTLGGIAIVISFFLGLSLIAIFGPSHQLIHPTISDFSWPACLWQGSPCMMI